MKLVVAPHPLLDAVAFVTRFPAPLGALAGSIPLDAPPPFATAAAPATSAEAIRGAVRGLLRHGGYKPTGRGKPASEYLLRDGALGPINAAVDACNLVSKHSGLPISVVDLARTVGTDFRLAVAGAGERYVFNASGQDIDLAGLLCLFDGAGPCANAVKDSQRTKTTPDTTATLSVIWGTVELADRTQQAFAWYRELLETLGATVTTLPEVH